MSQENVDRFHRAYDAFNRRDLDAFLAFMDPGVELTTRIMELEGDPYFRGHDGVREWWRTLFAIFPDFSAELMEVRDLDDSLIATVRVRGHGVEAGVPFEEVVWQAVKIRDGKATWWRNFTSEAPALEATELEE
jgi:ketosteroid isomerase-like protein